MSNGFERRKEQSKEDIRQAAAELFAQFGIERVSMAEIARKAGVSQATIYNNFGSKDALVREFESAAVAGLIEAVEQALAPEMPFAEKIRALTALIGGMIAGGPRMDAATTVFNSSVDLQGDPEIRHIRNAAHERMTAVLLRLAGEGRQQGEVNPRLSDEALRVYFRAFMDMFIDPELHRRLASSGQLNEELGGLLLYGLRGPRN